MQIVTPECLIAYFKTIFQRKFDINEIRRVMAASQDFSPQANI